MRFTHHQKAQCAHTVAVTIATGIAYVGYLSPAYVILALPAAYIASMVWIWFE